MPAENFGGGPGDVPSVDPFYPDGYTGEQNILETQGGGRIQIDPGQYIFFPAKKINVFLCPNRKFRSADGIREAPSVNGGLTDGF